MERNCWSARPVSMPFLNLIPQAEKSFGNGLPGTMVSTDQSWVTTSFVRQQDTERSTAMGHEVLLVDDPAKYEFGIPTRRKPAHLNSACYDSDGKILITLFHQGAGYVVDRYTGEARQK